MAAATVMTGVDLRHRVRCPPDPNAMFGIDRAAVHFPWRRRSRVCESETQNADYGAGYNSGKTPGNSHVGPHWVCIGAAFVANAGLSPEIKPGTDRHEIFQTVCLMFAQIVLTSPAIFTRTRVVSVIFALQLCDPLK